MGNKIKQAVQQQNQESIQRYQFTTIYNFEFHTNHDQRRKTTKVTFNNYVFEIKNKTMKIPIQGVSGEINVKKDPYGQINQAWAALTEFGWCEDDTNTCLFIYLLVMNIECFLYNYH